MLAAIKQFFDTRIAGESPEQVSVQSLQLATAALLLETVRADHSILDAEREAVQKAVRERFALDDEAATSLLALAEQEVAQASDFYQFTSLVNRHFAAAQKNRIVELMWEVAHADAHINAHERHLIRKIADLLHVTHGAYLAAQERAQARSEKHEISTETGGPVRAAIESTRICYRGSSVPSALLFPLSTRTVICLS